MTAAATVVVGTPITAVAEPAATTLLISSDASYQVDPVTGAVARLPVDGRDAVLSPKRDQVAYVRDLDPCVPDSMGDCPSAFDLLTANPDGTGERLVLSGGADGSISWPDWSADGKRIAFSGGGPSGSTLRGLFVVNADGTGLRSLDRLGLAGTFSPDGKQIANMRQQELWVMDMASGETHALTAGGQVAGTPDWSPDGKRIVFSTSDHHLLTIPAKGGPVTDLVQWSTPFWVTNLRSPVFSPDGTQVAYSAGITYPDDEMQTYYPAVLLLGIERGEPAVVAQQPGYLTDWIRAG